MQLEAERQRAEELARQAQRERELREQEAARAEQLQAFSAQTRKHAKVGAWPWGAVWSLARWI